MMRDLKVMAAGDEGELGASRGSSSSSPSSSSFGVWCLVAFYFVLD